MDLPQGADLAAYRLIAPGAVEELERSLLTFDIVADPVDLRKPALPEYPQDLEAVIDDVADGVVSGLGPSRRSQLCWVRLRQRLAATWGWCGGQLPRGPGQAKTLQTFNDFSRTGRPLAAFGCKQAEDEILQAPEDRPGPRLGAGLCGARPAPPLGFR